MDTDFENDIRAKGTVQGRCSENHSQTNKPLFVFSAYKLYYNILGILSFPWKTMKTEE